MKAAPITKHMRTYYCSTHPDTGHRRIQSLKPFGWDDALAGVSELFINPRTFRATSYAEAREQDTARQEHLDYNKKKLDE